MPIDNTSILDLIEEFRLLQDKDAITPDSLGYLLKIITERLSLAMSQTEYDILTDKVGSVETSFSQLMSNFLNLSNDFSILRRFCEDFTNSSVSQGSSDSLERSSFVRFEGWADGKADDATEYTNLSIDDAGCYIVYDRTNECFLLCQNPLQTGSAAIPDLSEKEPVDNDLMYAQSMTDTADYERFDICKYWKSWYGCSKVCMSDGKPSPNILYLCLENFRLYALFKNSLTMLFKRNFSNSSTVSQRPTQLTDDDIFDIFGSDD